MRPRPCLTCGALTLSSYCPLHKGTRQRGSAWHKVRALVLARDGHACVVCRVSTGLEVGHVMPKRNGGPDELTTLRTLCRMHHADKGGVRRTYKGASVREP
jgi:5-methylcytosine-specific restriction endonuclease McrA